MPAKTQSLPAGRQGLSSHEAKNLLKRHGPNSLPETPPPSDISLFLAQIKSPLVYILMVASIITFFLGHIPDTIIIGIAITINTVLGFIQERRASHALAALKNLIHPEAKVIRDNEIKDIPAVEVVPGDVALLYQGAKIPADGKIIESSHLFVSEAILTGESSPAAKLNGAKVFMGTVIVAGTAKMLVEKTGANTQIGAIAASVQTTDEETPLRRQIKRLGRDLTYLVSFLTVAVFVIGLLAGRPLEETFIASVALAVSAIPEGLLVGLTVILAIGMQRIVKRKGLVRHLLSAETLGGVTTICLDKTGTLTEGNLKLSGFLGEEKDLAIQAILANDLDDPIAIAAWEWAVGKVKNHQSLIKKHSRLDSLPFDSKLRFFASLNKCDKHNLIHVNGAQEFVLEWSNLSSSEKARVKGHLELLTSQGRRVMGLAQKRVSKSHSKLSAKDVTEGGLEWLGLLSFSDPVRSGVAASLEKVKAAGIKFLVITGDYPKTALAVMNELGFSLSENAVITGEELEKLSAKSLAKKLKTGQIMLFARTTPDQKLKIVQSLKNNSEVVAMMGDGVNDAPALKKADIGVVVGDATDVAKETADLILLDNNFETLVAAIEEGRGIFDNIRKVILYLMSDSFEEIICVVGTILIGLPLPVTAAQILWINLVSDGLPDLALTIDPKASGLMSRTPRKSKESIIAPWMQELIVLVSASGGLFALLIFYHFYRQTGDLALARSAAFVTLGVNSLVYVFSVRTLTAPFWQENPFDNLWLNLAVVGGLVFQFSPFLSSATRGFFGLTSLNLESLILIFSASICMFILIEVGKIYFRLKHYL